jgi:hypothetical protein
MKPPYKIAGQYPQNYIVDADGADVVTQLRCDWKDETDYMQLLCDALNANSDPTLREVEIPADFAELPPLPTNKSRWAGRGYFKGKCFGIYPDRKIRYYEPREKDWHTTQHFAQNVFHIEAV